MFQAYLSTVWRSPVDWVIIGVGLLLIGFHVYGFWQRWRARSTQFVQGLDNYRNRLLSVTELLPMLGLLGTVLSLMSTFQSFQVAAQGDMPDATAVVSAFAPAMSTTISGLIMAILNLLLNVALGILAPDVEG